MSTWPTETITLCNKIDCLLISHQFACNEEQNWLCAHYLPDVNSIVDPFIANYRTYTELRVKSNAYFPLQQIKSNGRPGYLFLLNGSRPLLTSCIPVTFKRLLAVSHCCHSVYSEHTARRVESREIGGISLYFGALLVWQLFIRPKSTILHRHPPTTTNSSVGWLSGRVPKWLSDGAGSWNSSVAGARILSNYSWPRRRATRRRRWLVKKEFEVTRVIT